MNLNKLRELAERRTKGKWDMESFFNHARNAPAFNVFVNIEGKRYKVPNDTGLSDTAFIAAFSNHADALLDVAEAAAKFEINSHDYPDQTNFFVSDQDAFLISQRDLAKALAKLEAIE